MNSNIRRFAAIATLTLALAVSSTATAAPRDTREARGHEPRLILIIKRLFGITIQTDWPSVPIPSTSH